MPPVHRQSDSTTGHPCWPPTIPASWSPNVRANGLGIVRNGDSIVTHCCPPGCHSGTYVGTSNVRVNGMPAQRVGHPVSCGDAVAVGSPNVRVP
jgi:uncharacterized Zn-binding protein involved in type VI secretion